MSSPLIRSDTEQSRPVQLVQRLDDVDARLRLVVGRDGVLEVEHHDVGAELGRLLEHPDVAAGDGQFAAVKAGAFVALMGRSSRHSRRTLAQVYLR